MLSGIRLETWNELAMDDYLYVGGELMRIRDLPKNPDDDCQFYAVAGQRVGRKASGFKKFQSRIANSVRGAVLRDGTTLTEDLERVHTLFPRIYERRSQLAGTLSGGEQQMVAVGRALMSRPRLLLMDEPSMGLAPALVQQNFRIIKEVHESGVSILMVEQNATMALSIADRGYVLSTGSIVLEGAAGELLHHEDLKRAYLGA